MGLFDIMLKAMGFEEEEKKKKKEKFENPAEETAKFNLNLDEKNNVRSVTIGNETMDVKVFTPKNQKEVQDIADRLKEEESFLVNFSSFGEENKIRAVDFLSGAIYLLKGKIQKVEGSLYYFAPDGILPAEFEIKR